MMKNIFGVIVLLLFIPLFFSACSRRVLEAMEPHKMHDEYFILRKNGRYSCKVLVLGVIRMPDTQHGRYIRSGDTVYFVTRKAKGVFNMYGLGIINNSAATFRYTFNDSTEWKTLDIRKMPTRKRDREMEKAEKVQ